MAPSFIYSTVVIVMTFTLPVVRAEGSYLVQLALNKEAVLHSQTYRTANPVVHTVHAVPVMAVDSAQLCNQLCNLGWEHMSTLCSCSHHHLGAWSKRAADGPGTLLRRLMFEDSTLQRQVNENSLLEPA